MTGQEGDYDWGDMDLPYLDVKNADVFEPVDIPATKYLGLSVSVAACLIKIRLFLDAKAANDANLIGEKVPQEVFDNIRGQMVSTIVRDRKDIMDSKDLKPLIEKLESQVDRIYKAVRTSNKYFWPALIRPGNNLTTRPEIYNNGTREHMQLVLQYSYKAWIETPGAVDHTKRLANES